MLGEIEKKEVFAFLAKEINKLREELLHNIMDKDFVVLPRTELARIRHGDIQTATEDGFKLGLRRIIRLMHTEDRGHALADIGVLKQYLKDEELELLQKLKGIVD